MKFILLLLFPIILHAGIQLDSIQDEATVFTDTQTSSLRQSLKNLKSKGVWMVVHTVKTLNGKDIETYAVEKFQQWKIGAKDQDNGILLVLAIDDKKMRLEVGYGLEGEITDYRAINLLNKYLRPAMREGNAYEGVQKLVDDIDANTELKPNGTIIVKDFDPFSLLFILIPLVGILLPFKMFIRRIKSASEVLNPLPEIFAKFESVSKKQIVFFGIFVVFGLAFSAYTWSFESISFSERLKLFILQCFLMFIGFVLYLEWIFKNALVTVLKSLKGTFPAHQDALERAIYLIGDRTKGSASGNTYATSSSDDTSSVSSYSSSDSDSSSSGGGESGGGGASSDW